MAGGHQPNRGPYGRVVTDALRYVLEPGTATRTIPGLPATTRTARRTARCTATASARCFWPKCPAWSTNRPLRNKVRDTLHAAVKLILDSQNAEGGWRYTPGSARGRHLGDHLPDHGPAAARNAGIAVPKDGRSIAASSTSRTARTGARAGSATWRRAAAAAGRRPSPAPPPASSR